MQPFPIQSIYRINTPHAMRKLLLLLTSIILFQAAEAQVKVNSHIGFNVIDTEAMVDETRIEGRAGFTAGIFARIGADNRFFLVPGLQYYALSLAGFQNKPNSVLHLGTAQAKYIKVPLNAALNLTGDGGLLKIFIQGGLTPSFTINSDRLFADIQQDIKNRNFVLGANIGVGVDVLFGTLWVNYEGGFTEVIKAADTTTNIVSVTFGLRL